MILNNKSYSKFFFAEELSTGQKLGNSVSFILGLFSGYYAGYSSINPEPSVKSDNFVNFITNKDNWSNIILKKYWSKCDTYLITRLIKSIGYFTHDDHLKLVVPKAIDTVYNLLGQVSISMEKDIEYKITPRDMSSLVYSQVMIQHFADSVDKSRTKEN